MLRAERNELITRPGPGTPLGALLRRYWQPAALVDPLGGGDHPLTRVRLFGEVFVLFRDDQGRYGLPDHHCAHRGADLQFRGRTMGTDMPMMRILREFYGPKIDVGDTAMDFTSRLCGSSPRHRCMSE